MIALAILRRGVFTLVLAVAAGSLFQPPETVRTAGFSQECAP